MVNVSIIIPVYNAEKFLEECLDSVINQTMQNIEIICVDDGSTDNSLSILHSYAEKDSRIKVLTQQNKFAGVARNYGLSIAQGKYCAFLDADDCYLNNAIETMYNTAVQYDLDMVKGAFYLFENTIDQIETSNYSRNTCLPKALKNYVMKFDDAPNELIYVADVPWNGLYRMCFLKEHNIQFNSLRCVNDHSFFVHCLIKAERIMVIDKYIAYYRYNQTNSLIGNKANHFENQIESYRIVRELIDNLNLEQRQIICEREFDALAGWYKKVNPDSEKYEKVNRQLEEFITQEFKETDVRSDFFETFRYRDVYYKFLPGNRAQQSTLVESDQADEQEATMGRSHGTISMLLNKIKTVSKKILSPILWVSIKRFDIRTQELLWEFTAHQAETQKTIAETRNKVNSLTKENQVLKNKIEALEQVIMMNSVGVTTVKRTPEIIVSMTSFPARIQFVAKTMERLLNQTVKPDRIILWLSLDQFPNKEHDLPLRLVEMQSQGLEIEWCDGDIRSYKKFIPALQKYPDSILIIVDDDLIYDTNMIETLLEGHRLFPSAIIASRAHRVTYSESGSIEPYMKWEREYLKNTFEPRRDLYFTGGAGTLIPPHSFTEEVFNYDIIRELCPYADDSWLNIMARLNNTPIVHTAQHAILTYTPGSQVDCLFTINRSENDIQLKRLIEHYQIDIV